MDTEEGVRFSQAAWAGNAARYAAIQDMPFNAELAAGTLSPERFRFYVIQDAHYLVTFAQALALAAVKADAPEAIALFSRSAVEAIAVERELHADYFRRFGIDDATVRATPRSPTCHHYGSFLLASGFREPLPVHLAALLPCFWVYREVGRHIVSRAADANPFRAWIDTYAGEDFAVAVDGMIAATDAAHRTAGPEGTAAMHRAFTRAVELEWMFWDSAYRLEAWPL